MFGIGIQELGLILIVALLVFGPKRLPELARTLGRGMREFRKASNDLRQTLALDELQNDLRSQGTIHKPAPPPSQPAQAGDDAPPGPDLGQTTTPGETPSAHPGELPLGNDEAHNDVEDDVDDAVEEEIAADAKAQRPDTTSGSAPATQDSEARRAEMMPSADPPDGERG